MQKITFIFSIAVLTSWSAMSQFMTPDTGVNWTLEDIATASPTTVLVDGTTYTLTEDLIISASDTFIIDSDLTLKIAADAELSVFGTFNITANEVTITALDLTQNYKSFRFEEFSNINIQNTTLEYGKGLRVFTENFSINNCFLSQHVSGPSVSAVISISRGLPMITNNTFQNNQTTAIQSGANQMVSGSIINNTFISNNLGNANRPQINMGPTRETDTLIIRQNTVIGNRSLDKVGGIGVSNLIGGSLLTVIEGNTVKDNRYGITITGGNAYAIIKNNIIEDNDTQGNPNLGGSGINLNSAQATSNSIVTGNQIRGNLWGVTLQGMASGNFGDDASNPGGNIFADNGNNNLVYALFNNTANTITAKHNCWVENGEGTLAEAESVISHQVDDSTLGEVIFDPINCDNLSISDPSFMSFSFYPNPATHQINFEANTAFNSVRILSMDGKLIHSEAMISGQNQMDLNLTSGLYLIVFKGDQQQLVKKLIIK